MTEVPLEYSVIAVGKPYGGAPSPGRDGALLTLAPGWTELTLFMSRPRPDEIAAVRAGRPEFAWVTCPHAGMLCFRLGALPWWDAPYEAHKASTPGWAESVIPGMHHLLVITLVGADDGITRALRPLTWPPHFTGAVRDAVAGHLAAPRDDSAARAELAALWESGTSEQVMRRAQATCTGGPSAARRRPGPGPGSTADRPARPR
jgi:hypothetical protein